MSLHKAGLSRIDAIHASTRSPALALGIADSIGTVEAGKQADLLVVNGDPAQDLENLRNVDVVFKGGARLATTNERTVSD